jgi:hypothetical protein
MDGSTHPVCLIVILVSSSCHFGPFLLCQRQQQQQKKKKKKHRQQLFLPRMATAAAHEAVASAAMASTNVGNIDHGMDEFVRTRQSSTRALGSFQLWRRLVCGNKISEL